MATKAPTTKMQKATKKAKGLLGLPADIKLNDSGLIAFFNNLTLKFMGKLRKLYVDPPACLKAAEGLLNLSLAINVNIPIKEYFEAIDPHKLLLSRNSVELLDVDAIRKLGIKGIYGDLKESECKYVWKVLQQLYTAAFLFNMPGGIEVREAVASYTNKAIIAVEALQNNDEDDGEEDQYADETDEETTARLLGQGKLFSKESVEELQNAMEKTLTSKTEAEQDAFVSQMETVYRRGDNDIQQLNASLGTNINIPTLIQQQEGVKPSVRKI